MEYWIKASGFRLMEVAQKYRPSIKIIATSTNFSRDAEKERQSLLEWRKKSNDQVFETFWHAAASDGKIPALDWLAWLDKNNIPQIKTGRDLSYDDYYQSINRAIFGEAQLAPVQTETFCPEKIRSTFGNVRASAVATPA
jgi:hypothetical protein